jgi:uncharacterized protein (TIGR03435 family)
MLFAVAAAALAWIVISAGLLQKVPIGKRALAQIADGSLYRMTGGRRSLILISPSQGIHAKEMVRSAGIVRLSLLDGSRVEMHSDTEMSLQNASDGLLLQLEAGDIIIMAAKQSGHLYVRTKDVDVSVVGTVFLVEAKKEGTRVAVVEGEVLVRQGASVKNLHPGEQASSDPFFQWQPLMDAISWSRDAAVHMAMLQRFAEVLQQPASIAPPKPQPRQSPPNAQNAFEVSSVKPGNIAPDREGRGGAMPFGFGCGGSFLQVDPGRFAISTNLFTLVALAYGKSCVHMAKLNLLSGGPPWVQSEQFTIQATIPQGSSAYTSRQLLAGNAPELQTMIRVLLEDRFKLVVRRQTKELQAYVLTVAKGGPKLTPFREGSCDSTTPLTPERLSPRPGQKPLCRGIYNLNQQSHFSVTADGATLDGFAGLLSGAFDRPVVNRTGIAGTFDFHLDAAPDYTMFCHEPPCTNLPEPPVGNPPPVFDAIQDQLGLKLESAKAPVEMLIIEHAERPSEN